MERSFTPQHWYDMAMWETPKPTGIFADQGVELGLPNFYCFGSTIMDKQSKGKHPHVAYLFVSSSHLSTGVYVCVCVCQLMVQFS